MILEVFNLDYHKDIPEFIYGKLKQLSHWDTQFEGHVFNVLVPKHPQV